MRACRRRMRTLATLRATSVGRRAVRARMIYSCTWKVISACELAASVCFVAVPYCFSRELRVSKATKRNTNQIGVERRRRVESRRAHKVNMLLVSLPISASAALKPIFAKAVLVLILVVAIVRCTNQQSTQSTTTTTNSSSPYWRRPGCHRVGKF